jgi:GcrA cell cycle regulator
MDAVETGGADKLPWTEARVEELKKLWTEGMSASQIARHLGAGATRNAVIGKLHRLGLSGRTPPARAASARPRRPREPSRPGLMPTAGATALKPHFDAKPLLRPAPEPEPEPIRLVDIPKGERVSILMLSDKTCRWPIGDPGSEDFCFCGAAPKTGSPYCAHHARIAYQPLHDRRRMRQAS